MKAFGLPLIALLFAACQPAETPVAVSDTPVIDKVNLFLGTADDYGQLSPGATVPFGMVQVCPDSNPRQHPGYDYEVPLISGISVNRLSGVGGSGCGGNVSLMPDSLGEGVSRVSDTATPGYYATNLSNGVKVELTATPFIAVERYTFPQMSAGAHNFLLLNPSSTFARYYGSTCMVVNDHTVEGTVICANTCNRGRYTLYYRLFTSRPFETDSIRPDRLQMAFAASDEPLEVRILLSGNGVEGLDRRSKTVWEKPFDDVRTKAAAEWEKLLSRVRVEGLTEDDQTIFYTSLYRALHSPFRVTDDVDHAFTATDGQRHTAEGFDYYSSWSLWDTYRTKFPLITLVDPERTTDIMRSLALLYQTGKKDWSTDHECVPTVRTEHATATLLDALRKGIIIPELEGSYPGMCREVASMPLKSPDQVIEAVADWWALGEMATELGHADDAIRWHQRGEALFDSIWPSQFMKIDDTFDRMKNNGLYQGTRWQYRWAAPQYLDRMIALHGRDTLLAELTEFFDRNLYNQGNEPDIHVPFLFGRLGDASRTAPVVHDMMLRPVKHIYGGNAEYPEPFVGRAFINQPRGYCPEMDEDDGTMSAWYVFASMGLYPLIVGEPVYELFSPTFDRITLTTSPGHELTIATRGRTDLSQPVRRILVDGHRLRQPRITHDRLMKAHSITFVY